MNIPKGEWTFPLLVLNHGYIDTSVYTNGRGLKREQDYMARNWFAVIHPDYRNHAFSDQVSETPYDFRTGYTSDVIAAIKAVQNSELSEIESVDSSKVGMLGHSMGSGVSQNVMVIRPDLIDALVLYWPVSNYEYDNFEEFQIWNNTRSARVQEVLSTYETPETNKTFWDWVSSKTFYTDASIPVLIFTWTADDSTPTEWAQRIESDLSAVWKEVRLVSYAWEWHEFWPQFQDFMDQSWAFFKEQLN